MLMRLMREVRFSVGPSADSAVTNSWAGWPSATGIQPWLVLQARVEGEPDRVTGYLCSIKQIDRVLRGRAIPAVNGILAESPSAPCERVLLAIRDSAADHTPGRCRWVDWRLNVTPYLSYAIQAGASMLTMTQCFEFSASHRLHCPELSDDENREIFGKCNNPNGHGHNYQLEVTVAGEPNPQTGVLMPVAQLERIVQRHVIDRLDHKHLNDDCAEFAGLNPSVENITKVIWNLLEAQLAPARLARVRVHETPKTCAEYTGPTKTAS